MLSNGLRYFIAVAQQGSIREAATHLGVAQSAISRQIQKLEEEMRLTLFKRTSQGVRLTAAGDVVLHHAKEMAQQTGRLQDELDAVRGVRRGHVSICTIESFANALLPDVLAQFYEQYPEVKLSIRVARTQSIVDALRAGTCQIGIAFCPTTDSSLVSLASRSEPHHAILASNHPLIGHDQLRLHQLLAYPIIAPQPHGGSRALFDQSWESESLTCQPVMETNSINVAAGLILRSQAIAVASINRIQIYLADGRLNAIPIASPILAKGRTDLLVRRNQRLPPAAEAFARAVARALSTA